MPTVVTESPTIQTVTVETPIAPGVVETSLTQVVAVVTQGIGIVTQGIQGPQGPPGSGEGGGGTPADQLPGTIAFGGAGAIGTSTDYAREDHNHPAPANPVTAHEAAADPHSGYQKESEKDQANGYAGLDGLGLVPDARIAASLARDSEVTAAISAHEASGNPHAGYATDTDLSNHAAAADPHAGYVLESLIDAKGDLIVGSAADAVVRLPAGTNGHVLKANSAQSSGLEWAAESGGGGASALDDLTDVAITMPARGHTIRHNGVEFVNIEDRMIDARDFNGGALNNTTIDAAVAAASPGDVVALAPGTWTLNATVAINKAISLIGAGIGRTELMIGGNFDGLSFGSTTTINHVRASGFAIGTTTDRTSGAAMRIAQVGASEFVDIYISNAYGGRPYEGLVLLSGANQIWFDRLRIHDCASHGVLLYQDGSVASILEIAFSGLCQVEVNGGHGVYLLNQAVSPAVTIEGIYLDSMTSSGNTGTGLRLSTGTGGVIKNIFLRGTCLDGNGDLGLYSDGTADIQTLWLEDVWVSHSINSHLVWLGANIEDFAIDGGHFNFGDRGGIYVSGARNGRIQNVSIMSNSRLQLGDYGINLAGNAARILIQGNRVYNNTDMFGGSYMSGLIIASGCADIEVLNNYLDTGGSTTRLSDSGTRTRKWGNVTDATSTAWSTGGDATIPGTLTVGSLVLSGTTAVSFVSINKWAVD